MKNPITHTFLRIFLLIVGIILSSIVALSGLNPNRKCATGDFYAISIAIFIFYIFWFLFLIIEAFILNKKNEKKLRNINLILAFFFPVLFAIIGLYFEIIN